MFVKSIIFSLVASLWLSFPINLIDQLQLTVTVCAVWWWSLFLRSECAGNLSSLNKLAIKCTHFLGALFTTETVAAALARKTSRTTNLSVSCNFKAINRDYYGHNLCFLIIIFLSLCRSHLLHESFMSSAFVRVCSISLSNQILAESCVPFHNCRRTFFFRFIFFFFCH